MDIGGDVQIDRVDGHQMAVLGRHEVGFDVIGAEFQCQSISRHSVLGDIVRGAPMANDQWRHVLYFRRELGLERALGVLSVWRECGR